MAEETLAFYPLIVTVMMAAGYDALSAVAVILLGAGIGVLGSTVNPFATGIASGFADVSIGDGLPLRLVVLVVGLAIGIFCVMRYAEKVKKDPSKSLVFATEGRKRGTIRNRPGRRRWFRRLYRAPQGSSGPLPARVRGHDLRRNPLGRSRDPIPTLWWWFPEMTASFLFFSILIGIAGGLSERDLTGSFVDGARDLLGVALIIGVARGITVIMNNGMITDTVLNWAEDAVSGLSGARFVLLLFLLFIPLSFLIPSSSGTGDGRDADHGAARLFRRCRRRAGRQRIPVRERARCPDHADLGGGHGRTGDRPDRISEPGSICLAVAGGLDGPLRGRIRRLLRRSSARCAGSLDIRFVKGELVHGRYAFPSEGRDISRRWSTEQRGIHRTARSGGRAKGREAQWEPSNSDSPEGDRAHLREDITRTRCAFEVAAYDQGAHVTYLGPEGSQIGHKESMKDTARVLGRMYDAIEYRGFSQEMVETLAQVRRRAGL